MARREICSSFLGALILSGTRGQMAPLSSGSMNIDANQLLEIRGEKAEQLRNAGQQTRDRIFGNTAFVRGVVEVSNYCRENCSYCGMRRDNRALTRFRIERDKIIRMIDVGLPAMVTDLNLQAGEDPQVIDEIVIPIVRYIRAHTKLGVSLSLGTLSASQYEALRDAGAFYYIIKLETGDSVHYRELHAPGTYEERLETIRLLANSGWKVSSGMIMGLPGQSLEMIAQTIKILIELPLAGVSVSPFIPGEETPFANEKPSEIDSTINALAILRIASPERIIPAVSAMSLLGRGSYVKALRAGANLVTMNLTPAKERNDYLLYKRGRTIMDQEQIQRALDEAKLEASSVSMSDYLFSGINKPMYRVGAVV